MPKSHQSVFATLPAELAAEFLGVPNADKLALVLDVPAETAESEKQHLQRTFVNYLNQHSRDTAVVRVEVPLRAYAQIQKQAEHYGLSASMFTAFQLSEADPRGFIPSLPFATALRRYAERMNALQ